MFASRALRQLSPSSLRSSSRATLRPWTHVRALSSVANADTKNAVVLPANSNQALGIAQFAIDFMAGTGTPDPSVYKRVEQFHTDSVACGVSALSLRTNAPTILREEATRYPDPAGATVFGHTAKVAPEKACVANSNAVREWDSNGTVFGYNDALGKKFQAGEFGHNDFYPVVVAACQMKGLDGATAARAMILSDEIRGRLAEVFSLKSYKIDHVVHGGIASAAVFGALMGATAQQIESAIGMTVAHYIPFRAIRAGHQLSDSKGASAAITTEAAVMSMIRSMNGFVGPKDIFRNPESIFRLNEPTSGDSPFDLVLSHSGTDFALMGMHFKLGLYEHQSAGALHGITELVAKNPHLATADIKNIKVVSYEPAFSIIGDPHKRNPTTRQSADHSMVYILSRLFGKAREYGTEALAAANGDLDKLWKDLILMPEDYNQQSLYDKGTRALMDTITFEHGGAEYDSKYPDGIPTSVVITDSTGKEYDSGFIMYPSGHARNTTCDLDGILENKFKRLAELAVDDTDALHKALSDLPSKSAAEIDRMYEVPGLKFAATADYLD